ncbi:hypothetical protein [Litorimonas sp. WD9-15]|uniref:hypothetical protein n=1 Tax=Litorimonas sp. WD9-15 TaxID=3418716 RepID=UPI003D000EFA
MEIRAVINSIGKEPIFFESKMDTDWVNAFNRTLGEHTIKWAEDITMPNVSKSGFETFYHLAGREHDALNVAPLNWGFSLKEPQTTGALVKFMSHSTPNVRFSRVGSFLRALHYDSERPEEHEKISIFSEYPTGDGRIDILIAWGKSAREAKFRHAFIVEVKQGAVLSPEQLKKYEDAAPAIADTFQFAFLFKSFCTDDMKQVCASDQDWVCSQWWAFLRRMEGGLQDETDDFEFRQFRSTLWEQLA